MSKYRCINMRTDVPEKPIWWLGSGDQKLEIFDQDGEQLYGKDVVPEAIFAYENGAIALEICAPETEELPQLFSLPLVVYGDEFGEPVKALVSQTRRKRLKITNYYRKHDEWRLRDIYVIGS